MVLQENPPIAPDELFSTKETAELLGIAVSTAASYVDRGLLHEADPDSYRIRISGAEIIRFIENREKEKRKKEKAKAAENERKSQQCFGCIYWKYDRGINWYFCHYAFDTGSLRGMPQKDCYKHENTPYTPKKARWTY